METRRIHSPEGGKAVELRPLERIVDRKRYKTEGATILADSGRNTWLLRSPGGAYFSQTQTCWQGEQDEIHPLSQDDAIMLYEQMPEPGITFEEAFPGVKIEEA